MSYSEIKARCLKAGVLYEDPDFPAVEDSLFFSGKPPRPFEWKRPSEICDNPQWITEGASRFDIVQGMLGDCWLLAAISSLTCNESLLKRVLGPSQIFTGGEYCGAVKFEIWRQGAWCEVVVDDRLPTYNGKLVFMHSSDRNEFWSALLEKAFAKLNGSYEALKGGTSSEAMVDFTGGITETFDLTKAPDNLFQIMCKALQRSSLMCCSIGARNHEIEEKLDNGLIKGHAYSVTSARKVMARTRQGLKEVPLVRVRNPWGNEREWTGAWSDTSSEWSLLSDHEKQNINLNFDHDGEFWMSFEDFQSKFTSLEICNLGADSMREAEKQTWESLQEESAWIRGSTAGGCRNFIDTFAQNPQFRLKLTDPDEDDDEDLCTLLIAVMQKDRRKGKRRGLTNLTIGFAIYDVEGAGPERQDKEYFMYHKSEARSANFINSREVIGRFKLKPGSYIIVPSTFDPNEEGKFLLRIFSEKPHQSSEMDEETRIEKIKRDEPTEEEVREQMDGFQKMFLKLAGEDEEIDADELIEIMNTASKKICLRELSVSTARSLIAELDVDMTGKLGFEEFKTLFQDLKHWQSVFQQFDADGNRYFTAFELRNALSKCGFKISNVMTNALVLRFSNKGSRILFEDFILIINRLKRLVEFYMDKRITQISLDDFLLGTINV